MKAVSELGESNSSDVVMAALSKSTRRRSSSTDSNQSYNSDHESTSSERKVNRKDSRKSKKSKSPRMSKHDKRDKGSSSQKEGERPPSRMENDVGIMTQPRLHKHKRNSSRDYQKGGEEGSVNLKPKETPQSPVMRSPKSQAHESQGFSYDGVTKSEHEKATDQSLSSTFTIDSQSSVLFALSTSGKSVDVDNSVEPREEHSKSHRRRRSQERKNEKNESRGDVSDSNSSVSSAIIHTRTIDGERYHSGTESPSVRRRRSKDSARDDSDTGGVSRNDSMSKRNSVKISPTAGSQGVPVIDGRRRHGSGSRPSSPALSDNLEPKSSAAPAERRRLPMGEILEQRFAGQRQSVGSNASSTATLTQSQVDSSASDLPPPIPKRDGKYSSLENLSTRSSHEYNKSPTERYSPNSSERRRSRNDSTCSESDIPANSSAARAIDMDAKGSSAGTPGNTGIVAKLLQKLQNFSKTQEDSLRSTKTKRNSSETGAAGSRKTSGDSESGETQGIVGHSDSSGAHSDDSQHHHRQTHRTHRRWVYVWDRFFVLF